MEKTMENKTAAQWISLKKWEPLEDVASRISYNTDLEVVYADAPETVVARYDDDNAIPAFLFTAPVIRRLDCDEKDHAVVRLMVPNVAKFKRNPRVRTSASGVTFRVG